MNNTAPGNVSNFYCHFQEDFKYILLPVSYSLVLVFGLALNATALYAMVFRTKRWKPSTIYMFNLTMCDTLYILTLPFLIYYYADENDWPFGSILFLCCISLHRFVGVCYPVRSLKWMSTRRAKLVSAAVWACLLFCQGPVLYFSRIRDVATEKICYDTTSPEFFDDFLVYSSAVSVVLFALPFMVLMVCYSLMLRKLLKPSWGAGEEGVGGGQVTHRTKQKSVKMIIIVLATFMLCFLPFHLTRSVYYTLRYMRQINPTQISCNMLEASSIAYKVTRPFASANSCMDPILYFLAGQDARSNLRKRRLHR
ncbi:P2Y purinoceptor 2 isoform X2 [Syngnathus acus]|uniref:P2Y purinoceptor 2 isoform X2 n=1 Tax=Syngnathus acus TaxID=161584 RepID=UPI001885AC8B|nr:P2Y purinoceptor 2 isoform X2 [Syngnathus acus]